MKLTFSEITLIKERIQVLKIDHGKRLSSVDSYSNLPEHEKIPLRINMAEIKALEYFMLQEDLDKIQKMYVEREQYCAAEGINKVKAWWAQMKSEPVLV